MRFEKWQALGNDYVIVEADALPLELTAARVRRICEPHFGVGSDGVLLLSRSDDPEFVAALRIFNPDGSEAELSGNGAREAILYLRRHGWTDADEFSIRTAAGPITPTITSERTCSVDMGRASTTLEGLPLGRRGRARDAERRRPRVGVPARLDRQPAVRDRGRRGARGARPGRDRPGDRRPRAVPQPHQRLLPPGRRQPGAGADLRARGGGDALLGHRRERRRRDGLPARGAEPDRGRARRRRAGGRDLRRPRRDADRLGRAGLLGRALARVARKRLPTWTD